MTLAIFITVYIVLFKDEFKAEDLEKLTPFFIVACIVILLLSFMSSLGH